MTGAINTFIYCVGLLVTVSAVFCGAVWLAVWFAHRGYERGEITYQWNEDEL